MYTICKVNEAHDGITDEAAKALCKINRKNKKDVDTEIELLQFGKFAVVNGALKALAEEQIIPGDEQKINILNLVEKFEPKKEKGYSDVRIGLAIACAGWLDLEEARFFLGKCFESDYPPLKKAAEESLKI